MQLVTKVDEQLVAAIDALIDGTIYHSRSDVVREGLRRLVDDARRSARRDAIERGYRNSPETAEELEHARRSGAAMIAEEPW